jgi:carbon starvation protein
MSAALVCFGSLILFVLAYRFYARWVGSRLFDLERETQQTPAYELQDGVDYVPTKRSVLFGHHFSSIAGAAPIVGPAIAIIWGWVPAIIWIVLGVIFMGAVHDFGALVLSMKHKGQSMAQVAEALLGKRARVLFLTVIFFLVWMVIAVFALVIANLFINFPATVIPVNFEIIIALLMGYFINRRGGKLLWPSIIALISLFIMIYVGVLFPVSLADWVGKDREIMVWIVLLLGYSATACVLPVWALLQPRDYINSHQLFVGLFLIIAGLFVLNPPIVAPAFHFEAVGAPPWFPFLFITIACGAISGFHGLVSSGTSAKQVQHWKDARAVGYGSMLAEGVLALLATLAVAAGFRSQAAWHTHYRSWEAADGLGAKISAFVMGASEFVSALGIPKELSETVIAVMIISFAATSLDTACRIQRYIIAEVGEGLKLPVLQNRFVGSILAVITAFALMMTQEGGRGGLSIWPLFGATNQMLAGLILLVITLYLFKRGKPTLPYLIPTVILLIITSIGLYFNILTFHRQNNTYLVVLTCVLCLAQLWVMVEGCLNYLKAKQQLTADTKGGS